MENSYIGLSRVSEEHVKILVREEMKADRKRTRISLAKSIFRYAAEMMVAIGFVEYFR